MLALLFAARAAAPPPPVLPPVKARARVATATPVRAVVAAGQAVAIVGVTVDRSVVAGTGPRARVTID